jgi:cardiolipin synthase
MIAEAASLADDEVLLQTFVWDSKIPGVELLNKALRLAALRKEDQKKSNPLTKPLHVYILIDERGDFAELLFNGGNILKKRQKWSCTVESLGLFSAPGLVEVHPATFYHNSFKGNHAKGVVIDSKTLIITGANFQRSNFGHLPSHEAALLMEGPVAKAGRMDFVKVWNLPNRHSVIPCPALTQATVATSDFSLRPVPIFFASRQPQHVLSNNQADNPIACSVLGAINNAQRLVQIATPNLNAPLVINALAAFINEREGTVQIVLGKGFNDQRESNWGMGGTNQYAVNTLRAAVEPSKLEQLQLRWFSLDGKTPVVGNVAGASHLKFMAVDEAVTIFGNANLDNISLGALHEDNVIIDDPALTKECTYRAFTPIFEKAVIAESSPTKTDTVREYVGFNGFLGRLGPPQQLVIEEVIEEGNGYKTLRLERPEGWAFTPGHYIEVGSGNILSEMTKGLSKLAIASGVNDSHIEITARASIKPWHPNRPLRREEGETLQVTGPLGTGFPLADLKPNQKLIVIGGGSGLTAIRSIMRSLPHSADVSLYFSAKTQNDLFYKEDVVRWREKGHTIALTREQAPGFSQGRITNFLEKSDFPNDSLVFLCGPEEMIYASIKLLDKKGISRMQMFASLPRQALQGGPVYRADTIRI